MSIDTVNDLPPRVQYTAIAAQTDFDYPFPIFEDGDLVVDVDGVTQSLDTDYTVAGEGEDAGGTITFLSAMAGGEIVTIYRDIAIARDTDFQQNGPFRSASINDELDKAFLIMQQLESLIARCLRLPITAAATDAQTLFSPIANWLGKYVTINSSGVPEPADISGTTMTRSTIGALLFPQTQAESDAGVTPTNYYYEPGDVRRYGAVGDGVADDTAAFLAAIQVQDAYIPYGTYKLTQALPLTQYGLIGQGWGAASDAESVTLMFYNLTSTTEGAIYTDFDNNKFHKLPIENIRVRASSWDGTTGALGYGMNLTSSVVMRNVEVAWFKKSGIFLHNTDTDGEAPYNSILENVSCVYNGEHGLIIGTGANTITLINYEGKYNGSPSYQTVPSVAGNYDGLYVDYQNAANPSSAYFSYVPEGLTVIGGNCSYNSRYGWYLLACQGGIFMPGYGEGNLQSSPGQVYLGNGLTRCFFAINSIAVTEINFAMQSTVAGSGNTNRVFVGGLDCGAGNDNTDTSRYSYAMAKHWNWVAYSSDQASGAVIRPYSTAGIARLARVGSAGGFVLEPPVFTVGTLPSVGDFSTYAMIAVSDETGGPVLAFSDGTNWRRVTDRAIVS